MELTQEKLKQILHYEPDNGYFWRVDYGQEVDHINGNNSDNRIANLREATSSQNKYNRKPDANKTGFTGIWKDKLKWGTAINVNKKRIHLGTFGTALEAHKAYVQAKIKYHGEFARTA